MNTKYKNPKFRFFALYGLVLFVQIFLLCVAILIDFNLSSNLLLSFIFCFIQDKCLSIGYPNSLTYEKKKNDQGFITFTIVSGLKLLPFIILSYLCLLLYILTMGYLKSWAYIVYVHLSGLDISNMYPHIPFYILFFFVIIIIFIYSTYKVYIYRKKLVDIITNYGKVYLQSNKVLVNAINFRKRFKYLPFYIYVLITLGCVLKTQACVIGLLALSSVYTNGVGYLILIVLSGNIHIVLCIPMVHKHFITNYGTDAYYLLGWNMFTQGARNIGKAAVGFVLFNTGRNASEQIANTINNATNHIADNAANTLVNAKRENLAQSLVNSYGITVEEARKTAAKKISYQHTPSSNARFIRIPKFSWPWSKDKGKSKSDDDSGLD